MTQTIIIEDEKPAARRLQRMLQKEGISVDVLLHSVSEALTWFQNNPPPGLIFADIQLSDGLSFDIFDKIQINTPVIFTTAYDQYAIRAFKLNSIDYLLKPIKQEELQFALRKYQENRMTQNNLQKLIDSFKSQSTYKQRFSVQYGQHLKSVSVQEIICFYSHDKTTFLITASGETFIYDQSLESIEKQLNPNDFFRVSRKFIIRYQAISDIISYTNSRLQVKLKNFSDYDIIVARDRVKDFKAWLGT